MWTNISTTIKCPRGDCLHTKRPADEQPCVGCTCNQLSGGIARTFRYEMKEGKSHDVQNRV